MVRKQEESLPAKPFILGKPNFSFRDKVFQHAVSLLNDATNSTYNMIIENGIYTILDILILSFKDIEDIECRIDNKRVKLSMTDNNRLKLLKSCHMHNKRTGVPLNINDWLNIEHTTFTKFHLSHQEKEYNVDPTQRTSTQTYLRKPTIQSNYNPVQ